jgi:hypothetical protein
MPLNTSALVQEQHRKEMDDANCQPAVRHISITRGDSGYGFTLSRYSIYTNSQQDNNNDNKKVNTLTL